MHTDSRHDVDSAQSGIVHALGRGMRAMLALALALALFLCVLFGIL